jgi:hypothetical protein
MLWGVAVPLPVRIAICIGAATFGVAGIRRYFLFEGKNAVRALAWGPDAALIATLGSRRLAVPVELAPGSFRLGRLGLFLWLRGCDGKYAVFIDVGIQEICAIRRLSRRLAWAPGRDRAVQGGQADTIGPKV